MFSAINNEVQAEISPVQTRVNVPSHEEQTPITATSDIFPTMMLLVIGSGAAIVVVVIIMVKLKKRGS